jgi:hypothetical protein
MSDIPSQFTGILLLHELPLIVGLQLFWSDVDPSHYSCGVENYAGRWISGGCDATVSWPSHSPDFNNFNVFASTVAAREILWR